MGIEKYFEREYNFLQTAGEDFAKKHPTLGSRLRMSERERKDPNRGSMAHRSPEFDKNKPTACWSVGSENS